MRIPAAMMRQPGNTMANCLKEIGQCIASRRHGELAFILPIF